MSVKHDTSCNGGKCSEHNPITVKDGTYTCCNCHCHAIDFVVTGSCHGGDHDKCRGFIHGRNNGPAGDIVPCACACHK